MNITCIVFGIVFLLVGLLFFIGKAHKYIEEYQKMSDEEKLEIQIIPLCRNIGVVIGIAGIGFLIAGIVPVFSEKIFIWYMILWFVCAGLDIRYISKSKRYINNSHEAIYIDKK